jgi:U4/U6 small nuclear ribonucleoprotein PRP31
MQVLGAKRKHLSGFSAATQALHQGFIFGCDVIQGTPPALRPKAARMVGAKCTLLARIDAYGQDPTGAAGAAMKVGGVSPCSAGAQ